MRIKGIRTQILRDRRGLLTVINLVKVKDGRVVATTTCSRDEDEIKRVAIALKYQYKHLPMPKEDEDE